MPEEPNQKMDALLKAYAEKRRGEAGPPFELHPATRNMLQGEVARTFGKPEEEAKPKPSFALWWKLALGSAAVVILAISISQSTQKKPERLALAGERKVYLGAPAPAASVAPKPVALKQTDHSIMDNGAINAPVAQNELADAALSQKNHTATFAVSTSASTPLNYEWKMNSNGGARIDNKAAGGTFAMVLKDSADDAAKEPQVFYKKNEDLSFDAKAATYGAKLDGDLGGRSTNSLVIGTNLALATEARASGGLAISDSPAKSLESKNTVTVSGVPPSDAELPKTPATPATLGDFATKHKSDLAAAKPVRLGELAAATPPPAPVPAATPALAAAPAQSSISLVGGTLPGLNKAAQLNFQQLSRRWQFRENVQSPPLPQLLNNFRIDRAGNTVQVLDEDGSVYSGEIVRAGEETSEAFSRVEVAKSEAKAKRSKVASSARQAEVDAAGRAGKNITEPAETFSFRVSGVNKRLNKKVVFTGQFLPQAQGQNFAAGEAQNRAEAQQELTSRKPAQDKLEKEMGGRQQTAGVAGQNISGSNRITGKVQVGRTTEFDIEALQNGP